MIVFNAIILKNAGNLGVAAYGIIANIAFVIMAIFTGISQGVQPIISKNYGMGKHNNVQKLLKHGILLVSLLSMIIYIVSFAFTEPIVSAFNKEKDFQLSQIATRGLRIYFIGFMFSGINTLLATYFGSIDKPKNDFVISILRGFIFIIPFTFILSALWGMTGIWLAMPFTELIVMIFSMGLLCISLRSSNC